MVTENTEAGLVRLNVKARQWLKTETRQWLQRNIEAKLVRVNVEVRQWLKRETKQCLHEIKKKGWLE